MIGRLISNAIGNTVLKAKMAVIFLPVYGLYRAGKAISDKIDDVREHNELVAERNRRSAEAAREVRDPLYRAQREAERARLRAEALERQRQWEAAEEKRKQKGQEQLRASNRLAAFFVIPAILLFIVLCCKSQPNDSSTDSQAQAQSSSYDDFHSRNFQRPVIVYHQSDPVAPLYTANQQDTNSAAVPAMPASPEQETTAYTNTPTPNEDKPTSTSPDYDDASNQVNAAIVEKPVPDVAQPNVAQDGGTVPALTTSSVPADSMLAYAGPNSGLSDKPLDVTDLRYSYITDEFLTNKSLRALSISYNGIYAMHGCTFRRPSLHQYFSRFSWYKPDPHFSDRDLSVIERHNIRTIRAYERNHFGY